MTIAVSITEEIITFFLWLMPTLGIGAAVAMYTYFKTGMTTYRMGRDRKKESGSDNWYGGLRKPFFTPGTVGYCLVWTAGYVLFAYAMWRFWLVPVDVREGTFGKVILAMGIVHWFLLPITAYCFLGLESTAAGAIAQLLNLGCVATILGLLWKIHADGSAALLGPGISMSIYGFFHLVSFFLHLAFAMNNRRDHRKEVSAY